MPERDDCMTFNPIGPAERRRLQQIKRYLATYWPAPYSVQLRVERVGDANNYVGVTYRGRGGLVIRLDSRMQFGFAVEILLHEWAHAVVWPASSRFEALQVREDVSNHCGAWQGKYAEIAVAFCEGDAMRESKGY